MVSLQLAPFGMVIGRFSVPSGEVQNLCADIEKEISGYLKKRIETAQNYNDAKGIESDPEDYYKSFYNPATYAVTGRLDMLSMMLVDSFDIAQTLDVGNSYHRMECCAVVQRYGECDLSPMISKLKGFFEAPHDSSLIGRISLCRFKMSYLATGYYGLSIISAIIGKAVEILEEEMRGEANPPHIFVPMLSLDWGEFVACIIGGDLRLTKHLVLKLREISFRDLYKENAPDKFPGNHVFSTSITNIGFDHICMSELSDVIRDRYYRGFREKVDEEMEPHANIEAQQIADINETIEMEIREDLKRVQIVQDIVNRIVPHCETKEGAEKTVVPYGTLTCKPGHMQFVRALCDANAPSSASGANADLPGISIGARDFVFIEPGIPENLSEFIALFVWRRGILSGLFENWFRGEKEPEHVTTQVMGLLGGSHVRATSCRMRLYDTLRELHSSDHNFHHLAIDQKAKELAKKTEGLRLNSYDLGLPAILRTTLIHACRELATAISDPVLAEYFCDLRTYVENICYLLALLKPAGKYEYRTPPAPAGENEDRPPPESHGHPKSRVFEQLRQGIEGFTLAFLSRFRGSYEMTDVPDVSMHLKGGLIQALSTVHWFIQSVLRPFVVGKDPTTGEAVEPSVFACISNLDEIGVRPVFAGSAVELNLYHLLQVEKISTLFHEAGHALFATAGFKGFRQDYGGLNQALDNEPPVEAGAAITISDITKQIRRDRPLGFTSILKMFQVSSNQDGAQRVAQDPGFSAKQVLNHLECDFEETLCDLYAYYAGFLADDEMFFKTIWAERAPKLDLEMSCQTEVYNFIRDMTRSVLLLRLTGDKAWQLPRDTPSPTYTNPPGREANEKAIAGRLSYLLGEYSRFSEQMMELASRDGRREVDAAEVSKYIIKRVTLMEQYGRGLFITFSAKLFDLMLEIHGKGRHKAFLFRQLCDKIAGRERGKADPLAHMKESLLTGNIVADNLPVGCALDKNLVFLHLRKIMLSHLGLIYHEHNLGDRVLLTQENREDGRPGGDYEFTSDMGTTLVSHKGFAFIASNKPRKVGVSDGNLFEKFNEKDEAEREILNTQDVFRLRAATLFSMLNIAMRCRSEWLIKDVLKS